MNHRGWQVGIIVGVWLSLAGGAGAKSSVTFVLKGKDAVDKGITWLKTQQNPDGSWTKIPFPAITGLITLGMLQHGVTEKDPVTEKAVKFLVSKAKPDGGIYDKGAASQNTAIGIMVLHATRNALYESLVKKGRAFLLSLQVDEGEGKTPDHPQYGGIGYDSKGIPDLQNLHWALMALRATDPGTGPESGPTGDVKNGNVWDKAIQFLSRCQNLKGSNDQAWAHGDGGFIYATEPESKVEGNPTQSYGTMTYAGLLSLIHAKVGREDPRVKAAYQWIQGYYSLDENPMMGAQGLFYGYHTFAKVLAAFGEDTLKDGKGKSHDWRSELVEKLVNLQYADGYWVNTVSSRWLEDNKELVTAYTILALEQAMKFPYE